jgi:hypothetical protein
VPGKCDGRLCRAESASTTAGRSFDLQLGTSDASCHTRRRPSVDLAASPARRSHHGLGRRLRRLRASHPRLDWSPAQRWPRRHPAQLPRATAAPARQTRRLPRRGNPTAPRSCDLGSGLDANHPAATLSRPPLAGSQDRPALAQGRRPQPRPARAPARHQCQPGDGAARGLADGWGGVHPPGQRRAGLLAADRR